MQVTIGTTLDEQNKLNKKVNVLETINAIIKENTSIIDPVFIINTPSSLIFNYIYCPDWHRYYFVKNITAMTGGRIGVECHVDVLNSFKDDIKKLSVIIDKQESVNKSSRYIDDNSYVLKCDKVLQSYPFPSGFDKQANILITAGGD